MFRLCRLRVAAVSTVHSEDPFQSHEVGPDWQVTLGPRLIDLRQAHSSIINHKKFEEADG